MTLKSRMQALAGLRTKLTGSSRATSQTRNFDVTLAAQASTAVNNAPERSETAQSTDGRDTQSQTSPGTLTHRQVVLPSTADLQGFLNEHFGPRRKNMPSKYLKIVLTTMRHEESPSAWGGDGSIDPELTKEGKLYAIGSALRSEKNNWPVPHVTFVSPLSRTLQTAEPTIKMHEAREGKPHPWAVLDMLRERDCLDVSQVTASEFAAPRLTSTHVKTEGTSDQAWKSAFQIADGDVVKEDPADRISEILRLVEYVGKEIHLRTNDETVRISCVSHSRILESLLDELDRHTESKTIKQGIHWRNGYNVQDFGQMSAFTCRYSPDDDSKWDFKITERDVLDWGSDQHMFDQVPRGFSFEDHLKDVRAKAIEEERIKDGGTTAGPDSAVRDESTQGSAAE